MASVLPNGVCLNTARYFLVTVTTKRGIRLASQNLMAKVSDLKTPQLFVDLPASGFGVVLYFNRFGIEKVDEQLLIHFGFVSVAGEVLSSYSAIFPSAFVRSNRSEWMKYLGKVGDPPERPLDISWRPPSSKSKRVEIVNALRVGRSGTEAEIRCYCVSIVAVIDSSRAGTEKTSPLPAQALALLQTTLEQQQLLLLALVKFDEL